MPRVLQTVAQESQLDIDVIETELFAAIRALEIDPKTMTLQDLRDCLMLYLDEVFYGVSPEKNH